MKANARKPSLKRPDLTRKQIIEMIALIPRSTLDNSQRFRLSGLNLAGVDLSFLDLAGANLKGSNLRNADLRGADLSYSVLTGADLSGADLRGSRLDDAEAYCARFIKANFGRLHDDPREPFGHTHADCAVFDSCDFTGADLSRASFANADMQNVRLVNANLYMTNFHGCEMGDADITGAKVEDANWRGVTNAPTGIIAEPVEPAPKAPTNMRYYPALSSWHWPAQVKDDPQSFEIYEADGPDANEMSPRRRLVATITVPTTFGPESTHRIAKLIAHAPDLWQSLRNMATYALEDQESFNEFHQAAQLLWSVGDRPYDVAPNRDDDAVDKRVNDEGFAHPENPHLQEAVRGGGQ